MTVETASLNFRDHRSRPPVEETPRKEQKPQAGNQPSMDVFRESSRIKDREKTLLRPTTLSPEERLKQVISLEDIKQLLMIARPYPGHYEAGEFLSLRA
ncbi:MAG: hypothetical protein HS115_10735 [Spirochaetales bacterium]|nr:hypothetical protein [Spirochaetales bacterium]